MNDPLVSIVIPCYNAIDLIRSCLKTILKTRYPNFEIIIIDDYSLDGTFEVLLREYKDIPKIRILRNKRNYGPSKTRNTGIEASKGKYVAFLETDMEVDQNWLLPLVEALEKDKNLGAVHSKVLDINKKDFIHSTGVLFNPHTFWVWSFATGQPKYFIPERLEVIIGSVGTLVRKSVLKKIGGFDEKIVHNIDDTDLGWRIWLAGFRCISIPDSITYHWTSKPAAVREKVTSSVLSEFYFHKTFRIFLKNYEWKNILRYTPWLFFIFSVRILKNLTYGNTKPLRGLLKALLWFFVNLEDTLNERSKIQKLRKRTDDEMFNLVGVKGSFFHFYNFYTLGHFYRIEKMFKSNKSKMEICPVCGGLLFDDDKNLLLINKEFRYATCSYCTLGVLLPKISAKTINSIYQIQNYFSNLAIPSNNRFIQWLITRRIYQTPSEWINRMYKKSKILDIGCGNGEFLSDLQKKNWQVWGIDTSTIAVENTADKIGKDRVILGDFIKKRINNSFDLVSFWHTLEHIYNPLNYLKKAYDITKPSGIIVGEMPNFESGILRFFRSNYNWLMIPEHVIYFNQTALTIAFQKSGFSNYTFYYPNRALLNLSLSLSKLLIAYGVNRRLRLLIIGISVPISVLLGILFSKMGNGEVIRFAASK